MSHIVLLGHVKRIAQRILGVHGLEMFAGHFERRHRVPPIERRALHNDDGDLPQASPPAAVFAKLLEPTAILQRRRVANVELVGRAPSSAVTQQHWLPIQPAHHLFRLHCTAAVRLQQLAREPRHLLLRLQLAQLLREPRYLWLQLTHDRLPIARVEREAEA